MTGTGLVGLGVLGIEGYAVLPGGLSPFLWDVAWCPIGSLVDPRAGGVQVAVADRCQFPTGRSPRWRGNSQLAFAISSDIAG